MRLSDAHVAAFAALSHDTSPLHVDETYARRTPFGHTVAHGMAGVLGALGAWAAGRAFIIERITARFHRPLFVGEDYALEPLQHDARGPLRIELARHGETHLAVELEWRTGPAEAPTAFLPFTPLAAARAGAISGRRSFPRLDYAPRVSRESLAPFALRPDQLPAHQLALLLWSSYVVGMEFPGRDALFNSLDARFGPAASGDPFHLRDVEMRFDERFGRATISGAGTGVETFTIGAIRRPSPIDHDLSAVSAAVGPARSFVGQTVLVTGSSRGLGAALARAFAVAGARVALSARAPSPELSNVAGDVASLGTLPLVLLGDAGDPATFAEAFPAGELDVLVNNAVPSIPVAPFLGNPVEDFVDFVARAVTMVAAPCHALLPRLRRGGLVVSISSEYSREPQPRLAHYVAAKAAVEGLTRTLALEHPELRFVIARPPRMLTDQTNTLLRTGRLAAATVVAAGLLSRLAKLPEGENLHEIDL